MIFQIPDVSVYLPNLISAFLILIATVIVAKLSRRMAEKFEKDVIKKTKSEIDDLIFQHASRGAIYIVYGVGVILTSIVLGLDILIRPILFILIILLISPIASIVSAVVENLMGEFVKRTKTEADDMVISIINKTARYCIYVLGGIVALDQLGIEVVPLVAGMGIAGIAIGLAAKDTLSNMISGIFIIIDKPFIIGDRIEVWNAPKQSATWGDVVKIGLRSTKIKTTDNIIVVIPNLEIAKRDIINYTGVSPEIRVRIPIGISYESDIKKAREIMERVAKETEGVLSDPAPMSYFIGYGESSQDLSLRVWIDDARKRGWLKSDITTAIKEEFDREGIEIPYPRRHIIIDKA